MNLLEEGDVIEQTFQGNLLRGIVRVINDKTCYIEWITGSTGTSDFRARWGWDSEKEWTVIKNKSSNFISLYDKLAGR